MLITIHYYSRYFNVKMYEYYTVFIATLVVWYLASYIKWWRNVYQPMRKLPGVLRIPIFGTKYRFIGIPREKLFEFGLENIRKMGPIFCTWTGSSPEVIISKAEYMEVIMNNSVQITKGKQYNLLVPWLGEGLLISSGPKWFLHRKLISPTFHFKILENFMEVFVSKSKLLLENLNEKANGKPFDIYPDITHCALDIICETAMGVPVNAMSSNNHHYVTSVYRLSEMVSWRVLRPYITDFIFKRMAKGRQYQEDLCTVHSFTRKVIAERKQARLENKGNNMSGNDSANDVIGTKKRVSFLDLLLKFSDDNNVLSDQDIAEEVDTFMFEGHDTTTAAISWTLFLLGNHPEIQERVYEELWNVLQNENTPTKIADLNELKYLENVIKESLRLYPSVPFIIRNLQQEVTIDKYRIPAGVQAMLHIHQTHRDPEYFPDPEKFDPDRFLPENSKGRHPYAYLPFSAGPRNCIGQKFAMYEEKTILASIIKRYKISSMETQETIIPTADLILRPLNGVLLKLQKRH